MAQDNRTIDQRYDDQNTAQQDKLAGAHDKGTLRYGSLRAASDAAYETMKNEARINKALSDLAGGPAATSMTHRQRSESAQRNEIGATERQRQDYSKEIDLALKNLDTQYTADQAYTDAINNALRNAEKLQQSRFGAELGLKQKYHELDKQSRTFDQMYKLYTSRRIDKNAFKDATGYAVKAVPAPRRVVKKQPPTWKWVGGKKPDKATPGYTVMPVYNVRTGIPTYYEVKNEVAKEVKDKGISLQDKYGNIKSEPELYADTHYSGYNEADDLGKASILTHYQDDFIDKFGKATFYGLQSKAVMDTAAPYSSMKGFETVKQLSDFLNGAEDYIKQYGENQFFETLPRLISGAFAQAQTISATMEKDNVFSMDELEKSIPEIMAQYAYTDSAADQFRKENGIVPEAFSWDGAAAKMGLPAWYQPPGVWDEQGIEDLLNTYLEHGDTPAKAGMQGMTLGGVYGTNINNTVQAFPYVGDAGESDIAAQTAPTIGDILSGNFPNIPQSAAQEILKNAPQEIDVLGAKIPVSNTPYNPLFVSDKKETPLEPDYVSRRMQIDEEDAAQTQQEKLISDWVILNTRSTFTDYLGRNQQTREDYFNKYKEIFGSDPTDDDMMALATRIQASHADGSMQSLEVRQLLFDLYYLPEYKVFPSPYDIDVLLRDLIGPSPEYTQAMADAQKYADGKLFAGHPRDIIANQFKKITGKTVEEATGFNIDELTPEIIDQLGKPLSEKDQEFYDDRAKYTARALADIYSQMIAEGENRSTLGTLPDTMLLNGTGAFQYDLLGLAGGVWEALGNRGGYWDRWTDYNTALKNLNAEMRMTRLAATKGYEPWMATAVGIGSGGVTLGLDIMVGKIIGSGLGLLSKSDGLMANPNIQKGIVDIVMPTDESKVLFLQNYGSNLQKYSEDDGGAFIALVESLAVAWVESSGGLASDKTLIEQGITKLAKTKSGRFFQKWLNDTGHEYAEEGVQAGISTALESATGKDTTTGQQEFGSIEAAGTTAASVALMTAVFTLAGIGADVDPIIVQYEQNNFEKARQLTAEALDSTIESGTLAQENVSFLNKLKANIVTTETVGTDAGNITVDVQNGGVFVPPVVDIDALAQSSLGDAVVKLLDYSIQNRSFDADTAVNSYYDYITAGEAAKPEAYRKAVDAVTLGLNDAMDAQQAKGGDITALRQLKTQIEADSKGYAKYVLSNRYKAAGAGRDLQPQTDTALSRPMPQNAQADIGDLFIEYFDTIGADEMPPLAEFTRMHHEGSDAWKELSLKKGWKDALRDGTIEPFTRFEAYKAMAGIDGKGGMGYNKTVNIEKFDFNRYLKRKIGSPPTDMVDPHAHHILFKIGNGNLQKALVQEGQALLERYGIDPVFGLENLVWAPNRIAGQHDYAALKNVVEQLKAIEEFGGTPEFIRKRLIKQLRLLGEQAASRR